jgi:hypothetical protein
MFKEQYPIAAPSEQHLLSRIAAPPTNDSPTPAAGAPAVPPPSPGGGSGEVALFEQVKSQPGPNITAKAMALVRSQHPNLNHEQAHLQACSIVGSLRKAGLELRPAN